MIFNHLKKWFRSGDSLDNDPAVEVNRYLDIAAEQLRVFSVEMYRTESQWLTLQEQITLLEKDIANSRAQAERALVDGNEELARGLLEKAQEKTKKQHDLKASAEKVKGIKDRLKEEHRKMSLDLQQAMEKREHLTARIRGAAAQRAAFQAFAHELGDTTASVWEKLNDQALLEEAKKEVQRTSSQILDKELEQLDTLNKEKNK